MTIVINMKIQFYTNEEKKRGSIPGRFNFFYLKHMLFRMIDNGSINLPHQVSLLGFFYHTQRHYINQVNVQKLLRCQKKNQTKLFFFNS